MKLPSIVYIHQDLAIVHEEMSTFCLGHTERRDRKFKIQQMKTVSNKLPDVDLRILIKKGPVSVDTSLKELEDHFEAEGTSEWTIINGDKVHSVPVEEFRLENPPCPNHSGQVVFGKKQGGRKQIDNFPVGQTIGNMNAFVLDKYKEAKQTANIAGKTEAEAERAGLSEANRHPSFHAVKNWLHVEAEIKLKRALESVMENIKLPALLIRSIDLRAISALSDLGLDISGDAEIDLLLAYASEDCLHIVIFEVKRSDTYRWKPNCGPPKKQAVNKAENQLSKDLEVLKAISAGIPLNHVYFHTLACVPDTSQSQLQTIICADCLCNSVICQEDVDDLSLLHTLAVS